MRKMHIPTPIRGRCQTNEINLGAQSVPSVHWTPTVSTVDPMEFSCDVLYVWMEQNEFRMREDAVKVLVDLCKDITDC
jgi:hypothetical protein